jgi:hypothetical protein
MTGEFTKILGSLQRIAQHAISFVDLAAPLHGHTLLRITCTGKSVRVDRSHSVFPAMLEVLRINLKASSQAQQLEIVRLVQTVKP